MNETKQGLIWIKGFSASGKTTVARIVEFLLRQDKCNVISLDGDELRRIFGDMWGYDVASRRELANAYFRLCSHLSSQGYVVVISAVAMFDDLEKWVQINIPNSMQVFLSVPIDKRKIRDSKTKKIFSRKNFNEDDYDLPKKSDIVIENYGDTTPDDAAKKILKMYLSFKADNTDRNRSDHWKEYYSKNIAPIGSSTFAEYVLPKMKKSQYILEIGCGNGRDAVFFASNGMVVDAIDRSEDAIKLCNNKHINTGIRFFSGEIDQVSNIDSDIIYDNIYCRFVIHAMPIEEEIVLIRNAFNLLKIGGSIFIECRSINDPMARKGEVISPTERINGHYRRFIIPAELEYRLKEAGFRVISLHEEENVSQYKDDNPVVIRATATKV